MEFWGLFVTALMPVLKVLIITALGTLLALNRFDILNKDARMHLNNMVYYVFGPAICVSILAEAITFKSLVMLWFMPVNILLTFIIGSVLGWLLIKITRAPLHLHGLVLGCCAAGNLGNMPLIILPAICKQRSRLFGDEDVCNRNGLAYSSVSMALGSIFIWTYVYNLVRVSSCKNSKLNEVDDSPMNPESLLMTSPENTSTCPAGTLVSAENISQTKDCANGLDIETARTEGVAKVTKQEKVMKLLKKIENKINLKALLAPGTIGSIIGLIIGVIPLFKKALVGENAPLHVIEDSISMLGGAAIPAMTLLVGANLASGLKASSIRFSVIIGIIFVRYIALPAFGVGILEGAILIGLIPNDPLYRFLLLLQYALPPAVTISTITQLFGAGVVECSIVMLATYTCASASLTLWSTFFIWLALSTPSSVSQGDFRMAITYLQLAIRLFGSSISSKDLISASGVIPTEVVQAFLATCKSGNFDLANKEVNDFIAEGYPLFEAIVEADDISDEQKAIISKKLGEADKSLVDGADEYLQLLDVASKIQFELVATCQRDFLSRDR